MAVYISGLKKPRAVEPSDYANLNIGEIVSGYVNQVHKSRDVEIGMVNQIQQKSEVLFFFLLAYCIVILLFLPYSSPQVYDLW